MIQMVQNIKHFRYKRMSIIFKGLPYDNSHRRTKRTLIILISIAFFITNLIFLGQHKPDFTEDYIRLLCSTEEFRDDARAIIQHPVAQAYYHGRPIEQEGVNDANDVERKLISVARRISLDSHIVLLTMINAAYLPFVYSWLCNTKPMDIHKSVLIVTFDKHSKSELNSDWPDINVVSLEIRNLSGNQSYSQVGYTKIIVKRTEMIQSLLMADINVFVFEVDCLWLANPFQDITVKEVEDIVVNPVASTNSKMFAGGFIWLRSTCRTKIIWQKVTDLMVQIGRRIEYLDEKTVLKNYRNENDQRYLATLIRDGYADVTIKILPLEKYADGKWYELTETERSKIHPVVINNNWIIGNKAKIERAKKWNHWFVREDHTCDWDLVYRTIHKSVAVA